MNIEFEVKKILHRLFEFNGLNDESIYESIDSVKYFRYLLTLEEKFNVTLDGKDISTINKTVKEILNENNKI